MALFIAFARQPFGYNLRFKMGLTLHEENTDFS